LGIRGPIVAEFPKITTLNKRRTGVGWRTTLTPTAVANRLAHMQPKTAPLVSCSAL